MPDAPAPAATSAAPSGAPTSDGDAVRLLLAEHNRNPVSIAKAAQREIRALRDALAKSGVPEGAVLLKGEDAKAWTTLQQAGAKVGDLLTAATERDTLRTQLAERDAAVQRDAVADEAAKTLGWNPKALRRFASDQRLTLEMRDVQSTDAAGQTITTRAPFVVRGEGTNATAEALDAFAGREHDVYLPALTAGETPNGASRNGTASPAGARPASGAAATWPVSSAAPQNGGAGKSDAQIQREIASSTDFGF